MIRRIVLPLKTWRSTLQSRRHGSKVGGASAPWRYMAPAPAIKYTRAPVNANDYLPNATKPYTHVHDTRYTYGLSP